MQSDKITGKKILITGGAGFIGSYLCEKLVKKNKVTVFDNLRRNALKYTSVEKSAHLELITGDVLDVKQLRRVIVNKDIVIHLAAIAGVSSYYENPLKTLEVDALGTYQVLHLSSEYQVQQVILFSTSEVYGPFAKNVTEETETAQGPATDSRWSYAVGKLIGDHFAFAFSKMKKLNVTIVRPFNIYGPRQVGEGAIQIFTQQALTEKSITIRGDGKQLRAWCYIDDFVSAIISMLNNPQAYNEIFNIGNPKATISVLELAATIKNICKSKSDIAMIKSTITDVIERSPNISKARRKLSFVPVTPVHKGLEKTVAWFKKYESL